MSFNALQTDLHSRKEERSQRNDLVDTFDSLHHLWSVRNLYIAAHVPRASVNVTS